MDKNYTSIESRWLNSMDERDMEIGKYTSDEALDTLCKAKALVMASWRSDQYATTKQVADYFEKPTEALNSLRKRHVNELGSDGMIKETRKTLKALSNKVKAAMNLSGNEASVWLWTPRSVLRAAMLLTESEVAKDVRTVMLDTVASVPELLKENAQLKAELAKYKQKAIGAAIIEDPRPWELHFDEAWREEAERVTGWKWEHSCMARFVNEAVYDHFPAEVRERLNQVNPVNPKTGRRSRKQHRHFSQEADPQLIKAIQTAYVVMRTCGSRQDFLMSINAYYGGSIQLKLF